MNARFGTGTGGKATVGTTSTLILPRYGGRQYAILINDSNEDIYVNLGDAAVMNSGILLTPKGGAIELTGENLHVGDIYAICNSGSKNLTYYWA